MHNIYANIYVYIISTYDLNIVYMYVCMCVCMYVCMLYVLFINNIIY